MPPEPGADWGFRRLEKRVPCVAWRLRTAPVAADHAPGHELAATGKVVSRPNIVTLSTWTCPALVDRRAQFRIAAENPAKMNRLRQLLEEHQEGRVLVIGEYIAQVEAIATEIEAPLVTGKTPQADREEIHDRFRRGELRCIVLSKVGDFAIDLPDADVLIQVSGMFGSRQEEAQRLGRILRPKADGRPAHFFTLVSRDTREVEFAYHRKAAALARSGPLALG